MIRALVTVTLTVGALAVVAACSGPKDPQTRGEMRFHQCSPCHGVDGHGNPAIEAPPIAGLPEWYIEAELTKFRIGARGAHFDDAAGLRMRPMALTMPTEEDVKAVSQFVAKLPAPGVPQQTLHTANAEAGKASFGVCVACHQLDGSGNQALGAPPIAGHPDWYTVAQLKKFKSGVRGAHPKDATGATMRAIALTLTSDQQMQDLAAYVAAMPRKK